MFIDDAHIDSPIATDGDLLGKITTDRKRRQRKVDAIAVALLRAAKQAGQTGDQARAKVEALFRTFVSETTLYLLLGTSDLADAISADVTLPWLDTNVAGKTIRTRLLERLA